MTAFFFNRGPVFFHFQLLFQLGIVKRKSDMEAKIKRSTADK